MLTLIQGGCRSGGDEFGSAARCRLPTSNTAQDIRTTMPEMAADITFYHNTRPAFVLL